jgi:hypothetical protein
MAIEIRIHEAAKPEWERLRERWGDDEARRWLAALSAWLRYNNGTPPQAVPDERVSPTVYWLLFGEVGVEYVLYESPSLSRWWIFRFFRRRRPGTRRVILMGFDLPGYPTIATPLPD